MKMKTILTFAAGFYVGGVAVVTTFGVSFGAPMLESFGTGLMWPYWAVEVFRMMYLLDNPTFNTL